MKIKRDYFIIKIEIDSTFFLLLSFAHITCVEHIKYNTERNGCSKCAN